MFDSDTRKVREGYREGMVLQMTQEITEPKVLSENAEYFTVARASPDANQIYAALSDL
jgi:hypothetical protein